MDLKALLQQLNNNSAVKGGLAGGLAGGLLAGLLSNKSGRKMAGSALTYGGIAALGGLAYKAWQNYQQGGSVNLSDNESLSGAKQNGFIPETTDQASQTALGVLLLRAMIAAAKADGHIDAAENKRIFDELNRLDLASQDKAVLLEEYSRPVDMASLISSVTSPQQAMEVYAASVLVVGDANPDEKAYLARLAEQLRLEKELVHQLDTMVHAAN